MAGQCFSWLLEPYLLLLLLARPLDHSSYAEKDVGISDLLPEELELQDVEPEPTPLVDMALVSWTCLLVELLITSVVVGRGLMRLWRRWRKEKHQSPSACAGPCRCRGRDCPRKLIQLLRDNRAMLRLCLPYCSLERRRAKRAAKGGLGKRRRPQASPLP